MVIAAQHIKPNVINFVIGISFPTKLRAETFSVDELILFINNEYLFLKIWKLHSYDLMLLHLSRVMRNPVACAPAQSDQRLCCSLPG